jgi:NadR type nicotinamide-nucleotide adenylyltransferase
MEKRTGLVLGKFAPLHKGHQHLIETALSKVDKLFVLVYDAKQTTDIPLKIRCQWIKYLYPNVVVIEGKDSPEVCGDSDEVKKIQDAYILSVVNEKITHFFSSEWYGEHVSAALGAKNIVVDIEREKVPISATLIRKNRSNALKYLHPIVNRDVVKKIVFLGAESTGKTTLVKELAKLYHTEFVEEYGRQYWEERHDADGKLSSFELLELAVNHCETEEVAFRKSHGITFVDTNAITTWTYSQNYNKSAIYIDSLVSVCKDRYDFCFLCDIDIPLVQDGTRADEEQRKKTQKQLVDKLNSLGIEYHTLTGPLEKRISEVQNILLDKFEIKV